MNQAQIQITAVENGYLVMSPRIFTDEQKRKMSAQDYAALSQQPIVHFCVDGAEVLNYLKRFFPPTIS